MALECGRCIEWVLKVIWGLRQAMKRMNSEHYVRFLDQSLLLLEGQRNELRLFNAGV